MMDRCHHRKSQGSHRKKPVAKGLDVVDHVKSRAFAQRRNKGAKRTHAEREGFRQEAKPGGTKLVEIQRLEDSERIGPWEERRGIGIEAFSPELGIRELNHSLGERHRIWIGWSHEDVYLVPGARELAGEMPEVDALASAVHVAPIADKANA